MLSTDHDVADRRPRLIELVREEGESILRHKRVD
jgi:hypothetical protein